MKREIQYLRKSIYLPLPPPNAKGGSLKVHRQYFFPQAGGSLEVASYSLMLTHCLIHHIGNYTALTTTTLLMIIEQFIL